jgi:putative serine protease PepD
MSDNQDDRPTTPQQPLPPQAPPAGWQPPVRPAPPVPTYTPPAGYVAPQHQVFVDQNQPTMPLGGPRPSAPQTGAVPAAAGSAPAREAKSGGGKVVGILVAAAIVGGAAGLGGAYAGSALFDDGPASPAAGPQTVTVNDTDSVNQTTAIAAKVVPSVVTISAASGSGGGTGSGVILTSDGYVVTNTHVVTLDGATGDADIRVTTSDGRVYDAEVVGTDPTYDLAVIKLKDASGLTPIEFADSSKLNVGDETIAVGAPLGLANTVTTGIVSALNRSIEIASSAAPEAPEDGDQGGDEQQNGEGGPFFFDFGQGRVPNQASQTISIAVIQTDAAINPGNSGGALVDSEGKLIGINVAIATAGGSSNESGSIGVGFSIPSSIAERITDEIIADGEATHGLLGAMVRPAASVEGATMTGAYLNEIVDGGAAADAGLEAGDIVTEFNGVPITDATDLTAQVRAAAGDSDATLTYVRDGESHTIELTLGTLDQ